MKLYAGFDLGGTQLKYGLVDEEGEIASQGMIASPKTPDLLWEVLENIWGTLPKGLRKSVKAVGLGLPGIFNRSESKLFGCTHFPALDGLVLENNLSHIFSVPFHLDNEANLAAYGEYKVGGAQGADSLVLLTIGTGIGTGIIIDGRVFRGSAGYAGELGHVPVNPDGESCACGSRGCLETEVSATAILRHYRHLAGSAGGISTAEEIGRMAVEGDPLSLQAFQMSGKYLGIGLSIVINLLNPEVVLIGGGVSESGSVLMEPALDEAGKHTFRAAFETCRIQKAALGNAAGFVGAALWAHECESRQVR
ncbi:ROK family protein [Acidobacteriota bacterium]